MWFDVCFIVLSVNPRSLFNIFLHHEELHVLVGQSLSLYQQDSWYWNKLCATTSQVHCCLICVLSSWGGCALLIEVTLLETSLSTISKVHINLHMFFSGAGPEKKIHIVFLLTGTACTFQSRSDYDKYMERVAEGREGEKKETEKESKREETSMKGSYCLNRHNGNQWDEWHSFGWGKNAQPTSDPPHHKYWACSLPEVEKRSVVSSQTTISLCLTERTQTLKHLTNTRKPSPDICPK